MKTLFLFIDVNDATDSFFFELIGDYSHLNETFINAAEDEAKNDELTSLVYDHEGSLKVIQLAAPTSDWTHFVKVGIC